MLCVVDEKENLNMPAKITLEGKKRIEDNIQELMEELKKLRKEKVVAYNLTGDTWHDNPYFNKLEQDERVLNTKINEAQEILKNAEIVDSTSRNMETVEIGSIVKCICNYLDLEENEIEIFEIVGHGKTDVNNGKIHYESLVAQNIMGLHVNDTVTFSTSGGKVEYKIAAFYEDWETAEKERGFDTKKQDEQFEFEVSRRELERDAIYADRQGMIGIESWHPGNLAYAMVRNPDYVSRLVSYMMSSPLLSNAYGIRLSVSPEIIFSRTKTFKDSRIWAADFYAKIDGCLDFCLNQLNLQRRSVSICADTDFSIVIKEVKKAIQKFQLSMI